MKGHVELTETSIRLNGLDISDTTVAYRLEVSADEIPRLMIESAPDFILFAGTVDISDTRYDGIERLRQRLTQ